MPANPLHAAATPGDARAADLSELLGHVNASWDEERRSLSRQLHDSLGSSLTALTMHLSLLAAKLPQDKAVQDRAAQMKTLLMNVIETNRQMQVRLWNDKLEFLGVTVALRELVEQFGEREKLTVRCSLPEDELVCPRSMGVALLRTLEEALANIARHAGAGEVDVIVDDNDEEVMLTIKDNGAGMQPGAEDDVLAAGKHGLRTVRERVAYLGGSLVVSPNPAGGTIVTATLPRLPA